VAQGNNYEVFEPGLISTEDYSEGSPTITADGKTLLFTRYKSYGSKVPYFAIKTDESWDLERVPFADTVYTIALAPDGERAFFNTKKIVEGNTISRVFTVSKNRDGEWQDPVELKGNIISHGGYFRVAMDGTLYMYVNAAAGNPKGIYYSEPADYSKVKWLSDAISVYGATVYSPLPNDDETKIIVNRAGISDEEEDVLGESGLYLHEQHNGQWTVGQKIDGIPYTWIAEVTSDDRLLFVKDGDIQSISLDDLNIVWND
jgi:hypothetical protein